MNTTVASIALFVNSVLSQTYHAIYGAENGDDELILVVAPLASNTELQQLYTSGIIDYESAMPAALHSLGCSSEEIASAMQRRREQEAKKEDMERQREKAEIFDINARINTKTNTPNTPDTANTQKHNESGAISKEDK